MAFGYDNANRRTSVTFPNGIVATSAYNARDLTGITFTLGATTLGTLTYTTDADGRRTQVGGTWARVTLPAAITTTTYNANNQQTKVGTKTLTYDLNGNLTKDGNGNITYTWDARNRLTATSASNATFQYDPLGRRTKKVLSGTTTRFHFDGVNPVQELDNAGNIVANLLTGLEIDEVFTRTASSTTRTLLPDALHSTLAMADNAGAVQTTYTYEPFGTSAISGQTNTNSYQYTGRENDATGLDYYRARYYSPSHQRFISEDPIGFAGGDTNLYAYVRNNPNGLIDPTGLVTWPARGGISSGFGWRTEPRGFHDGIDIRNPIGGPVVASDTGIVLSVDKVGMMNQIIIRHEDGAVSTYGHTTPSVKAGFRVQEGDVIGFTDMTGRSSCPHLHYTCSQTGLQKDRKDPTLRFEYANPFPYPGGGPDGPIPSGATRGCRGGEGEDAPVLSGRK